MSKVKRVYVEKKQPYAVKAKELTEDIKGYLGINTLDAVRVLVRYDVENLSEDTYKKALTTVFSEPPVDNVYEENFPFSAVKNFLQEKFGTSLTFDKIVTDEEVFNEKLSYKDKSLYHDGVKLTVSSEYMIPSLESGIVVYIGEKENYKQVVIVQQMNGVDVWYGNIKQANVKLYDYVEKGSLIGQVDNKTLYLVFQKEGKFVDYQSYLAKS